MDIFKILENENAKIRNLLGKLLETSAGRPDECWGGTGAGPRQGVVFTIFFPLLPRQQALDDGFGG